MDTAQLYESLNLVLSLYADVEPSVVADVMGGDGVHTDAHQKFILWCVLDKRKFFAACVLAGAEADEDIDNYYQHLKKQTKQ